MVVIIRRQRQWDQHPSIFDLQLAWLWRDGVLGRSVT